MQETNPRPPETSIVAEALGKLMNKWLFLTVLTLSLLVFGICWLIAGIEQRAQRPGEFLGTIAGFFSPHENPRHIAAHNYKFWTPSDDTTAWLTNSNLPADKLKWYTLQDGEDTLKRFGAELITTLGVQGYSRWRSIGQGTSPIKSGWTWEMTVDTGNKKFTDKEFLALYQRYFSRDRDIYLEITEIGDPNRRAVAEQGR